MVWIIVPAVVLFPVEPSKVLSSHPSDTGATWLSAFGHGSLAVAQRRFDLIKIIQMFIHFIYFFVKVKNFNDWFKPKVISNQLQWLMDR